MLATLLVTVLAVGQGQVVAPPATLGMPLPAVPGGMPTTGPQLPAVATPATRGPALVDPYGMPIYQPSTLPGNWQQNYIGYGAQQNSTPATGSCSCSVNGDKNGKEDSGPPGCFFERLCKAYVKAITAKDDRWEKEGDKDKKDDNDKKSDSDKKGDADKKSDTDKKNGDKDAKQNGTGNGDTNACSDDQSSENAKPARRALPEPWSSPPFPGHEYQGYPLIGVPPSTDVYPFMEAIYGGPCGDAIKDSRIKFYGWVTASGNASTAKESNAPTSYWVVPNRFELDQLVMRFEREPDMVQTDHCDWGFRSTIIYGMDYRYTTAGGWGSDQLLHHNLLYGWDPIEQYMDFYDPDYFQGVVLRVGRWVACPDIETQLAPDNYMGSHSILFTFDTYTQTGTMLTMKFTDQWMFQVGIDAGDDMAPWYQGAVPCGFLGLRWVGSDNNDAVYTCVNQINDAKFSHFTDWGVNQPAGHDNYNYVVSTWEHRFNEIFHTKTEAYFMWERDAEVGGTPSLGPVAPFGGGGGNAVTIPGTSLAYGVLNYTMYAINKQDYITLRNEWYRDETGFRTGFAGNYTSHTIGLSHNVNAVLQVRPEIGYYRNWTEPAFDNGTKNGIVLAGFDVTLRF